MDPGALDRIEALKAGIPKGTLDGPAAKAEALSAGEILELVEDHGSAAG